MSDDGASDPATGSFLEFAENKPAQRRVRTYKAIVVPIRGGPDVIQIEDRPLVEPSSNQARIRVLASPLVQDDIAVRVGNRPFKAELPFTPGYSALGVVDAIGKDVTSVTVGDRVAALTAFGGHSEYLYWEADQVVQVPDSLDPAEAVVLILNYLVAYQVIHRVASARPGDKALIIGASGGVGTAFLQLGSLAGLSMIGLASPSKHFVVREHGATPIDYHRPDLTKEVLRLKPQGMDYVFNGMGEEYFGPGLRMLRRGGVLVHYGGPQSFPRFLVLVARLIANNVLPNGKTIKGYGTHRLGVELFKEDWAVLFGMLERQEIKPIIADRFPLLEARKANEQLEAGQVVGNLVLLAPELLE